MKLILRYMKRHWGAIALAIAVKLVATVSELLLPTILEHIIDEIVPTGNLAQVLLWGFGMFIAAIVCRQLNVDANTRAIDNAHRVSFEVRQDLFERTMYLSGSRFDELTLPSLISRMTSDSYNVQSAVQMLQSMCVRAPMLLIGGVAVAALMDLQLTMILLVMLPVLILIILFVSSRGIPLYTKVQEKLDAIVRIMRENITGIRVVKALSKEDSERERYSAANEDMTRQDILAAVVMAIPSPLMQLFLNIGLSLVVLFGAYRVNMGYIKPGVILAFLTYFNMITMGVMGLSRIFMILSKANASANRIAQVLAPYEGEEAASAETPAGASGSSSADTASEDPPLDCHISFDHVSFSYGKGSSRAEDFAGLHREKALEDISFSVPKGGTLGIIGPTGCGKSTIVSLLMRFYDADGGKITVDGRDVRAYNMDALRGKFGTVFQNDMIFMDTLRNNIDFDRGLPEEAVRSAVRDAMAQEFIDSLDEGLDYGAAIKGANLSGGQKQRIFIARALAGDPEILILDDSSSALDYKTDAAMRRSIAEHRPGLTTIMIAQRISSVMNLDRILVLDNGRCIGYGTHKELLDSCPAYRETYEIQMGEMTH